MFATLGIILAATPATEGAAGFFNSPLGQMAPLLLLPVLFYFMIWRPQSRRAKEHAGRISAVKRGDGVVLTGGILGKVVRVEEQEVQVEIAPNVNIKVVKAMIAEVRTRGEPAPANDAKA
jgi:preprotein translocase subunit YajC